jgi:hypothetical protein
MARARRLTRPAPQASEAAATTESKTIAYCKIHPAIGIARVGNSPNEFFIGPEIPGVFDPPSGGYKDAGDLNKGVPPRVKRQAARFRIFAYNTAGQVVQEITEADAEITWTVHLANKKAEWDRFDGRAGEDLPIGRRQPRTAWRNRDIRGTSEADDREARRVLIIDPGSRSLTGPGQVAEFTGGAFFDIPVPLGEIRTDAAGRLLVLGGSGHSGTSEPGRRITTYANNDRWYDDVSDGPVTAKVRLREGQEIQDVRAAWVVVAPPDFAPGVANIVTLYDAVYEVAVTLGYPPPPLRPSFTQHIAPLLHRPLLNGWVQAKTASKHGPVAPGMGNFALSWNALASNLPEHQPARQQVFERLRNPQATSDDAIAQATERFMPPLSGDDGDATEGAPGTWLTPTKTQYDMMKQWAAGEFESDWSGALLPPMDEITPAGLDRAALEACAGGAFFPGIEGGWMFRNPGYYKEPFRFDPNVLGPGDVTKRMAVPWQADFFECREHWWPAQRPDEVLSLIDYERIRALDRQLANPDLGTAPMDQFIRDTLEQERRALVMQRQSWTRIIRNADGSPADSPEGDNQMVQKWARLGFLSDRGPDGESFLINAAPAFVETATVKYEGLPLAEYFHYLVNIEDYPDFLPMARQLALDFLAKADYSDPHHVYFEYTPETFDQRLENIYDDYVATMDDPHWLDAENFSTRAVIESLRQKAPLNLIDGAWLQQILSTGPCDEVRARLFAIWVDEAGNGKTELNHCNVYDALLHSMNVYLPPITSRPFSELDLLPSAWSNPVFQLSVGQFPQDFFPELLGMTLYLEWEATPTLTPTVRMLQGRNIDPHFYRMHVAIDNVASGHGALAKEAIKLYLDTIRKSGGEQEMQHHWRRIWNGYVTWATEGTFGGDLYGYLLRFDGKQEAAERKKYTEERLDAMIQAKAPYARKSHGSKMLGAGANRKPLNALFNDPPALRQALLEDPAGWVNLANPRDSRLFIELLTFSGPMYKVFTPEDQDVILDWLEALRPSQPPPPPTDDPGQKMKELLENRQAEAAVVPAHRRFTLPDTAGSSKTVQDWFRESPEAVMEALARSEFIIKGAPDQSTFFTEVLVQLMPAVFSPNEVVVMRNWVAKGCPPPGGAPPGPPFALARVAAVVAAAARGEAPAAAVARHIPFALRRHLIGAGSVH